MRDDITVVISCAGMGTSLGISTTKSLLDICGKPLIIRQLELLNDIRDIRLVVGYDAEEIIKVVTDYRKDIMFSFNYDYNTTGAGASLSKSIVGASDQVLTIDGDLVINPSDLDRVINYNGDVICGTRRFSNNPIWLDIKHEKVVGFSEITGQLEWSGLAKISNNLITPSNGHVYQILIPLLPIDYLEIQTIDIDTVEDYEKAINWVNGEYR